MFRTPVKRSTHTQPCAQSVFCTRPLASDGGPSAIDQRRVVDASFLDLVRYGIERAHDPAVRSSLPVVDAQLKVSTPNGPFWRRYTDDGYGETPSGGEWLITQPDTQTSSGKRCPFHRGPTASSST